MKTLTIILRIRNNYENAYTWLLQAYYKARHNVNAYSMTEHSTNTITTTLQQVLSNITIHYNVTTLLHNHYILNTHITYKHWYNSNESDYISKTDSSIFYISQKNNCVIMSLPYNTTNKDWCNNNANAYTNRYWTSIFYIRQKNIYSKTERPLTYPQFTQSVDNFTQTVDN